MIVFQLLLEGSLNPYINKRLIGWLWFLSSMSCFSRDPINTYYLLTAVDCLSVTYEISTPCCWPHLSTLQKTIISTENDAFYWHIDSYMTFYVGCTAHELSSYRRGLSSGSLVSISYLSPCQGLTLVHRNAIEVCSLYFLLYCFT